MQAHNRNGISIGSAVFAQMTADCPYLYDINYSNTTKNNILFIDVSASRRKPSSGLTSGAGRQYVKACPIREAETSINTMLFLVVLE